MAQVQYELKYFQWIYKPELHKQLLQFFLNTFMCILTPFLAASGGRSKKRNEECSIKEVEIDNGWIRWSRADN